MSLIKSMAIVIAVSSFSASVSAIDILEPWAGFSSPDILSSGFTHSFYSLPLEGATNYQGPKYWSGDYWPSKAGGINVRWASSSRQGFNTASYTRADLQRMSSQQLAALSPSEKYDIYTGRYDYPLKNLVSRTVSPRAAGWEGICHGWAVAALHHNEPAPKTLRNRDGVAIPFGSADIKALLSYYYANLNAATGNVGLRCNFGRWTGGARECDQDLNAGAFHIILANRTGLRGQGIIMDVERFSEVWNQPVIGYRSRVLGEYGPTRNAARGAVREVRLQTELWYIDETAATWEPVHGTSLQKMDKKDLTYRVELNARGEIIGGTWESEARPDFIWDMEKAQVFGGHLARLGDLLNDSGNDWSNGRGRPTPRTEYEPTPRYDYEPAPRTEYDRTPRTGGGYYDPAPNRGGWDYRNRGNNPRPVPSNRDDYYDGPWEYRRGGRPTYTGGSYGGDVIE